MKATVAWTPGPRVRRPSSSAAPVAMAARATGLSSEKHQRTQLPCVFKEVLRSPTKLDPDREDAVGDGIEVMGNGDGVFLGLGGAVDLQLRSDDRDHQFLNRRPAVVVREIAAALEDRGTGWKREFQVGVVAKLWPRHSDRSRRGGAAPSDPAAPVQVDGLSTGSIDPHRRIAVF